ncbi:MAG: hypothetical protein RIS41_1255 [Actinomycetota bacterium]|jgi:hypothetical protein
MWRRSIGLVAGALVLSACGATVYDESAATTTMAATTTTLPTGTAAELLPRLVAAMSNLSILIGPVPDDLRPEGDKRRQLAEIEALWDAVEREVTADDPETAETLTRMVDLARQAVEKNRPADADKAAKFAAQVVNAYAST